MFSNHLSRSFNFLTIMIIGILLQTNDGVCMNSAASYNASLASNGFSQGLATSYDGLNSPGSGGACGYFHDLNPIYNGLTAAGNNDLFKAGVGCGACYQVKCTGNPSCSGNPVTLTITNQCPDSCNNEPFHFDMSGKAFQAMAKPGQGPTLWKAGRLNIEHQRVPCNLGTNIAVNIMSYSNVYTFAFSVEYVNGDGDLGKVELLPSNSQTWISMKRNFGATWDTSLNNFKGPFSVRVTTIESQKSAVLTNVIPADWKAGQTYYSKTNV